MRKLALLVILFLSGCQTLSDLDPPSVQRHFVLEKDLVISISSKRKPDVPTVIYGLRAGRYSLVGENEFGYFYKGQGDSVFQLTGKLVDRYLQKGEIAAYPERHAAMMALAGGSGGLWLPRPGVTKPPLLFFESIYNLSDAMVAGLVSGANSGVAAGVGSAGGMVVGLGVISAGNALANKSLLYFHLKGQEATVTAIAIADGP